MAPGSYARLEPVENICDPPAPGRVAVSPSTGAPLRTLASERRCWPKRVLSCTVSAIADKT